MKLSGCSPVAGLSSPLHVNEPECGPVRPVLARYYVIGVRTYRSQLSERAQHAQDCLRAAMDACERAMAAQLPKRFLGQERRERRGVAIAERYEKALSELGLHSASMEDAFCG
jgi:hypothetical protein